MLIYTVHVGLFTYTVYSVLACGACVVIIPLESGDCAVTVSVPPAFTVLPSSEASVKRGNLVLGDSTASNPVFLSSRHDVS